MFDLPDDWVWDFWVCRREELLHAFFLKAPRTLVDPERRHRHASAGHAVSQDLSTWTYLGDALQPQRPPAFDDLAIWTGCVVEAPGGDWRMFTTGLSTADDGLVQRIGVARSPDLTTWRREPKALLEADPRWYATVDSGEAVTHWRDPWVFHAGDTWHLLATARSAATGGAVVAHAVSPDLEAWEVCPPISAASRRFLQTEVVSALPVQGRWVLLFSCLSDVMPSDPPGAGGVWSVPLPDGVFDAPADGSGCVVDLDRAVRLTDEDLYVGRLVPLPDGDVRFLAFRNRDATGRFVGGLIDPRPVEWLPDGSGLRLAEGP